MKNTFAVSRKLARAIHCPVLLIVLLAGIMMIAFQSEALAGAIRSGFDGTSMGANDDGSTGLVPIGFNANFFGTTYSNLYVNNNGNVTFDGPLNTYTPFPLTSTGAVIIAPFFADVDTNPDGSGIVTYGTNSVNGHAAFAVNWVDVAYFAFADKLNSFQVVLIDRSDVAAGDFDIEFNYDQVQWETGSASNGTDGLGGSSARAGYANGSVSSYELAGSGTAGSFLDTNLTNGLIYNSLNSGGVAGRYVFQVRSGVVSAAEPPVAVNDSAVLTSTSPIAIPVLANDSDPQSSPLTITAVTPPSVGQAVINGSTIIYTPDFSFGGYAGTDSFTYVITNGLSLSATATVTISNPFYLEKGNFAGTLNNTGGGYVTLNISNNGRFSGKLRLGKKSYTFTGLFNVSGYAYLLVNGQALILNMDLTQLAGNAFGSYTLAGSYDGVAFNSYHALYNSTSNPAPEAGKYTVLIDPPAQIDLAQAAASVSVTNGKISLVSVTTSGSGYLSVPTVTITSSTGSGAAVTAIVGNGQVTGFKIVSGGTGYPTTGVTATIASPSGNPLGFGYATLSVGENGVVNISGKLADGTNISDGVYITGGATPFINQFPVYINLGYSNPGSLIGALTFEDVPGVSDCDGTLTWIKPVQTSGALYQGGVNATVATIGSRYTPPLAHELALELPAGSPNATVTLNEQDWANPISKAVTVGLTLQPSTEKVTVASPGADLLQMSINANAGSFSGSFLNPSTGQNTPIGGVLFHKQIMAGGYFLSPTMGGVVNMTPEELP